MPDVNISCPTTSEIHAMYHIKLLCVSVCLCFYLCICVFLFLSLSIRSMRMCVTMNRLRKLRGEKKNIVEVAIAAVTATRHKLFYIQYQHFIQFFIKMDRVDRKIQSYLYQITFLSFPLPACIRLLLMPLPLSSRRLFSFSFTTFMYTQHTPNGIRFSEARQNFSKWIILWLLFVFFDAFVLYVGHSMPRHRIRVVMVPCFGETFHYGLLWIWTKFKKIFCSKRAISFVCEKLDISKLKAFLWNGHKCLPFTEIAFRERSYFRNFKLFTKKRVSTFWADFFFHCVSRWKYVEMAHLCLEWSKYILFFSLYYFSS